MTVYRVSGKVESGTGSALPTMDFEARVRQAVRVQPTLRDGGPVAELDVGADDLLEIELENGFVLWTTVDRLLADADQAGNPVRGDNEFPVSYPLQRRGTERGSVAEGIRAIRVLGIDLPKKAAELAAEKLESKLAGDGQLFRVGRDGQLTREDPPETGVDDPTLILIHGTFSSTGGSYSGLYEDNRDVWEALQTHYDGRVFGFEHKTLSKSPIDNAIEFLEAIPRGANLHLVSHSRGGLVGDLIAHGGVSSDAFAMEDLERELKHAYGKTPEIYNAQLERYLRFNQLIAEKAPRVTRFVRVGCPAAGTTLASKRMDVYLSVLIHLMRKVPGLGPLLGAMGEFVAVVAKERTKVGVLPGLQAQMPKSAFVRLLNSSPHKLESDLTVLSGDSDGLLKNLANLFYWGANDLVVDTRSMYGGAERTKRLWYLEENRHVTHMNYFSRAETARVVQRGLMRADGDYSDFNLRKPRGVKRGGVDGGRPDEQVNRAGVILLPGIMGSNLSVKEGSERNRVWLDKLDIVRGRGRWLSLDSTRPVVPDSVLDSPYERFRDDLVDHSIHVMPMPYDWRLSLEQAADQLRVLVDARLTASDAPLHLMAHSMGGLVSSLYINKHPESWARLRERGGRLVQAGTPNRGSYSIPRIFSGDEQVLKMIALLDLRNDIKDWLTWISRFPGLLQMAPMTDGPDFSRVQTWRKLGARVPPSSSDLRQAEQIRQKLTAQSDMLASEGVLYVAGGPEDTPVFDEASEEIRFTQRGDGRVTWASIPDGLPTWYLPVKHGDLLNTRKAFDALRELLFDGRTTKLTQTPPFASDLLRGETLEQPLLAEPDEWEVFPSQDTLEGAAIGMSSKHESGEPTPEELAPCRVSVVHGDLRFTNRPMIVGHYRGDPIVHAERVLCDCLDGALSARHQLGVYPGPSGTADVVLSKKFGSERSPGPTGAIVVGLGNVGELSPGSLNRSVEVGLLRFAQAAIERGAVSRELKISALLVGTNEVGITTSQALDAILSAVVSVNRALQRVAADGADDTGVSGVRIADLEFVELYEDIALDGLHSLREFEKKKGLQIERTLQRRGGRQWRSRTRFEMGWWTRVQIRDVTAGASTALTQRLQFTAYGDRARAPISEIGVQKPLVDQLVHDAIIAGSRGETRLPQTLFELLVPGEFKPNASDRRNVQLVLDPASAVYPWELLVDRYQSDEAPVGLGAGLLRQLRVETPPAVSHSEDTRILVVGDPPSGRVALPGAVEEANAVAEMFDGRFDWEVIRCINDGRTPVSATDITSALVTNDLRILHLAGHGEYDKDEPTRSGMVIGGGASEIFISAEEVKRMRPLPELVFINCCHIGKIEETPPLGKLAASLAQAFIEAGAKAVVAAGWPIEDQAAKRFALEFYSCMLNGDDFGTAVTRARQEAYKAGTNTWGAYQCYGDSGFRLLVDQGARRRVRSGGSDDDPYWDISEARIALQNLVSRAQVATTDKDQAAVASTTEWLWRRCERRDWLGEPGILVGFARAYAEQSAFEQAVALYEQAMQLPESGVTIKDLEQLANFRVRTAADTRTLSRATRDLDRLIRDYGATGERVSLLASAYKRLAKQQSADQKATLNDLRETWLKMTSTYAEAVSHGDENWFYPAGNALLGVVVLGGPWSSAPRAKASRVAWDKLPLADDGEFHGLLEEAKQAMQRQPVADFWDAVGPVDLEVTEYLEAGTLPTQVSVLAGRYRDIAARYGSGRELNSVMSHWRIAERVLRRFRSVKHANALKDLLSAIDQ